ncbi:3'-5' exonuclease [Phocaeicola plebeius]|uniref:3'-5' exonuclease n=1 Tax=Phocaeicola plebeius TaxID=310297 RepID=UPI0035692AEB
MFQKYSLYLPHHCERPGNQPLQNLCITEKVFVSTVHKTKGLVFENVIIFEVTDGVYPFFDKKTPEKIRESAKLFYVAMIRAKKRLHITYSESVFGTSKWGNPYSIDKELTPFLRHIKKYFNF